MQLDIRLELKKLIRTIINRIPFKLQIFKVLRNFGIKQSIYRHLHFKGDFKVWIENNFFYIRHYGFQIENELFWAGLEGGWEHVSIGLWTSLCRRSEVILDIGANTGIYSLIAKTANPNARIYAFEPVKRVYEKLNINIQLNNFNIFSIEKAISNFNGEATIFDPGSEHIYSVTLNKNTQDPEKKVNETIVETIRIDTFFNEANLAKIDLIKIDVETHEPEVLEGIGIYLSKFKPTILIEVLNDEVGAKIEDLIKDLNYLFFNIDENTKPELVKKITKSHYYNYLICTREVALEIGLI